MELLPGTFEENFIIFLIIWKEAEQNLNDRALAHARCRAPAYNGADIRERSSAHEQGQSGKETGKSAVRPADRPHEHRVVRYLRSVSDAVPARHPLPAAHAGTRGCRQRCALRADPHRSVNLKRAWIFPGQAQIATKGDRGARKLFARCRATLDNWSSITIHPRKC